MKCLAVLGVRKGQLLQKTDFNLTHNDVQLLGLFPIRKSNGEVIKEAFDECAVKIGGNFLAFLLDQGSDIGKGARLHIAKQPETKLFHDISHKLSLVMEYTLKDDQKWMDYKELIGKTINRVKQSVVAPIAPSAQRGKDRYMNIGKFISWPDKIWECRYSEFLSEEKYEEYFKWTEGFKTELSDWQFYYGVTNMIKNLVRDFGYSKQILDHVVSFFEWVGIENQNLKIFIEKCVETLAEEVNKLSRNEFMLGSTEVIESIFGKFKEINQKSRGISGNVLSMACYVGPKFTKEDVKKGLEGFSVKDAIEWVRKRAGETLLSARRKAFMKRDKI